MEKEKNKITIKADTGKVKKLVLKKKFITSEKNLLRNNILELNNEFNPKKPNIKIIKNRPLKINNIKKFDSKYILSVKKISKSLGGKPILKNISFNLNQGQIIGLLGPNGAGKSTLFNIIIGKIFPDTGDLLFNNESIVTLPIHQRALKGISLLEQNKGLFSNLTAYENLYAVLELYMEDKNKITNKINYLMNFFGLQYLSNVKASNMSGGEYKKITTLQRICNKNIKILLLDEPMAALDPISISSIKKFILELREMGLSVIITDHNFFAIQDILDNCIIINNGEVMFEGRPKNVLENENARKYYLGTGFNI